MTTSHPDYLTTCNWCDEQTPASLLQTAVVAEPDDEGYLEYPNFTKPQEWRGISVPEILLSGNHAEIAKWRSQQADKRANDNL